MQREIIYAILIIANAFLLKNHKKKIFAVRTVYVLHLKFRIWEFQRMLSNGL